MNRIDRERDSLANWNVPALFIIVVTFLVLAPFVALRQGAVTELPSAEVWRQIAVRQQVRADVLERFLRECRDQRMNGGLDRELPSATRASLAIIGPQSMPSPSSESPATNGRQSGVIPCHLPIKIRADGKLEEPCTLTAPAPFQTANAVWKSNAMATSADIAVTATTSSLINHPSQPPESPVVCPSDALGPVTAKWNAVSVDWYRKSQSYPPDERLPWLFQCRGDFAQQASADASKDPTAARDIMGWLLTWLFDHGVVARDVSAWHHFTVTRPASAVGVTDVFLKSSDGHWAGWGEIDRDGMNGDIWLDPDCTDKCEVWYWAPMVPMSATVVSWGKQ